MGVRGLTTYIEEHQKLYLQPYELCNTNLVVDGNNIASHLYAWISKSDSAFGGDYDEYYKTVKGFFNTLKKCQVTPIVLFDGGYEKKKLKTVFSRATEKVMVLNSFNRGFTSAKFFPLFMKQTFFDVMEDMRIACIQCDFEADVEIAAVAKALNCPVLSYDSDFYIYDVLYIPFSSVQAELVRVEDFEHKVKCYVKCSVYDVTNFLNEFEGLDKSMLPLIATLLGNDYIESSIFYKFFNHVIICKDQKKSYTQRKIHGVLHWLKKENLESATKLILSHLENKNGEKVLKAIKSSINDYTKASLSPAVSQFLNSKTGFYKNEPLKYIDGLPSEIKSLFYQLKIHKFLIDMITFRSYFTQVQLEDLKQESTHLPSLQLIKAFYTLINSFALGDSKPLKVYLIKKNSYSAVELENDSFLANTNLCSILEEPKEIRLKLLYDIVGVADDINTISNFSNTWLLFIIAFIYWIKKVNNSVKFTHIHALLLTAVANQIVQKNIGYFKNHSKFMKKKGSLLKEFLGTEVMVKKEVPDDFKKLLASVSLYECLLIQQVLIPFRQTTEKSRGKAYCISTVHLFNCFQSCLYHIMQLNSLLNYPLPHLKISDFYSGTLLFNFYVIISQKTDVEKFGSSLLEKAPNVKNIYMYLYKNLCKYSVRQPRLVQMVKKKKSRKGKKVSNGKITVSDIDKSENCDEYNDENNYYAILKNLS